MGLGKRLAKTRLRIAIRKRGQCEFPPDAARRFGSACEFFFDRFHKNGACFFVLFHECKKVAHYLLPVNVGGRTLERALHLRAEIGLRDVVEFKHRVAAIADLETRIEQGGLLRPLPPCAPRRGGNRIGHEYVFDVFESGAAVVALKSLTQHFKRLGLRPRTKGPRIDHGLHANVVVVEALKQFGREFDVHFVARSRAEVDDAAPAIGDVLDNLAYPPTGLVKDIHVGLNAQQTFKIPDRLRYVACRVEHAAEIEHGTRGRNDRRRPLSRWR